MASGKALTFLLLSLAAVHCRAGCTYTWGGDHHSCSECDGGVYDDNDWGNEQCTACQPDHKLEDSDGDGHGWCVWHTCDWSDDMAEDWYGKILIGSIFGIVFTLVTTVVTSLPVCCGVMKDNASLKLIAIVCGVIAGISYAIPFISGALTAGSFTDDICDSCGGCSDKDRKDLEESISALGVLVAYIHGFGFVVVILSSVTLCLSCCICCPCCGPLKQAKDAANAGGGAPAVQGQVIGAPPSS